MAATALLLPSLAAPTARHRRGHRLSRPQLQLQRGSLPASRALRPPLPRRRLAASAVQETKEGEAKTAEEITEKYGLEFGLWKVFSSKEEEGGEGKKKSRTDQAKELLAKYGGAYLATSISLSLVSFTLCYLLISAGVDVQDLLAKVPAVLFCCLVCTVRSASRRARPEGRSGPSRWPTPRTRPRRRSGSRPRWRSRRWWPAGSARSGSAATDAPVKYRHFDVRPFCSYS